MAALPLLVRHASSAPGAAWKRASSWPVSHVLPRACMPAGDTAARAAAPTSFPLPVCGWPAPVPASASPLACGRPAAESTPVPPSGLLTCSWPAAAVAPCARLARIRCVVAPTAAG
jgi:hypothetical protein